MAEVDEGCGIITNNTGGPDIHLVGCRSESGNSIKRRRIQVDEATSIENRGISKSFLGGETGNMSFTIHVEQPWQLPLEIFYMIFDLFWDHENVNIYPKDQETLRACSLTCKWWYAAVRPYLFRSTALERPEDFAKLATKLRREPQIADWVRKIRLEGQSLPYQPERRFHRTEAWKDLDQWLYPFPTSLNDCYHALRWVWCHPLYSGDF